MFSLTCNPFNINPAPMLNTNRVCGRLFAALIHSAGHTTNCILKKKFR